jgi:hypothetical protein
MREESLDCIDREDEGVCSSDQMRQVLPRTHQERSLLIMPTINDVIRHWKVGEPHRFHVIGTGFDRNPTIDLEDDRAEWAPATLEPALSNDKHVVFQSRPIRLHRKHLGPGALTITITNADTSSDSTDVEGSYEP